MIDKEDAVGVLFIFGITTIFGIVIMILNEEFMVGVAVICIGVAGLVSFGSDAIKCIVRHNNEFDKQSR